MTAVPRIGDEQVLPTQMHEDEAVRQQREDVVKRQRRHHHLPFVRHAAAQESRRLKDVGDDIAVAEHRSLGAARGAAGVLQERQIRMLQRGARVFRARPGMQRVAEPVHTIEVPFRHQLLHVLDRGVDQRRLGKGKHVAEARQHDMLQRHAIAHPLQRMCTVFQQHDDPGAGIAQLVLQFAGGVERIDVDRHATRAQRTEQRYRVLQHVGHHQRDAIAASKSGDRLQPCGEFATAPIQLGIAQAHAHIGESRPLRVAREAALADIDDRAEFLEIHLERNAGIVTLVPWMFHGRHLVRLSSVRTNPPPPCRCRCTWSPCRSDRRSAEGRGPAWRYGWPRSRPADVPARWRRPAD